MNFKISVLRLLPVLLLAPALAFSASAVGKVRSVLGDVDRQKAKQKEWAPLRVSSPIYQTDRVRTGQESEVVFGLPDGSIITIAEFAEVEMSQLLESDGKGAFKTRLDIKKGHVNFAVHKLKEKKSSFTFKTATATAAIRGTNGFIGGGDTFFASLATGKLEISLNKAPKGEKGKKSKAQSVNIVAGETVIGADTLVTMKLASSGDTKFAKKVEKIIASGEKDVKVLVKKIEEADAAHQEELKNATKEEPTDGFTLNTASPVTVCDDGLTIEGSYFTKDTSASLILKVGSFTSENLIMVADGKPHNFSQKIALSDANNLWNETSATISFVAGSIVDVKNVDLTVDKACPGVNQKAPSLKFLSYDSIACKMFVSVGEMLGDAGILTISNDGAPVMEEALTRNEQKRVSLSSGVHKYEFSMKDQAGNEAKMGKDLGCYPVKHFNIDVYGNAKEVLKVPPPPKGMQDRITKTLQFKIRSPENDPLYLYKVTVKHNGKVILQESLAQIQSLDYQIPLDLMRNAQNRFDIEVVHKSGFTAKAQKIFEVR